MSADLFTAIVNGESRRVQQRGGVTLPVGWREEHGIEPGDNVVFLPTDDGELRVIPPSEV